MHKQNKNLPLFIIGLILLVVAATIGWYFLHTSPRAQTTSKAPSAQSDYHSGAPRGTSGSSSSAGQGGAIDTHGQDAGVSSGAQQITSQSGAITLFAPLAGATVKSGDVIAGEAHLPAVNYRLVDNKVGVIAQGQLSVNGDKYSGKLQFSARGENGKLDMFSYDPTTGAEVNIIEISINF